MCWLALTVGAEGLVPAAAYLWAVPLLVLAAVAVIAPAGRSRPRSLGAVVVIAASGAIWLPEAREMLRFGVPLFGRLPIITPVAVFPSALLVVAVMIAPGMLGVGYGDASAAARRETDARASPHPGAADARAARRAERRVRVVLPGGGVHARAAAAARGAVRGGSLDRGRRHGRSREWSRDWTSTSRAVRPRAGCPRGPLLPGVRASALPHPFAFRAPGVVDQSPIEAALHERNDARWRGAGRDYREAAAAGLMLLFAVPPGIAPDPFVVSRASSAKAAGWRRTRPPLPARPYSRPRFLRPQPDGSASCAWAPSIAGCRAAQGWLRQPAWLASARTVWHARSLHLVAPEQGAPAPPLR